MAQDEKDQTVNDKPPMNDKPATETIAEPGPAQSPQATPVDGLDGTHITFKQIVKGVYALFYNKKFGVVLILAAGLLSLLGIVFPQAPAGTFADPESKTAWLGRVRGAYGGWTDFLATAGFFNMFSSLLFQIVMVALALSILACTTHRLPLLWRTAFRPHVSVTDGFFNQARYRDSFETSLYPQTAYERATEMLKKRRWRVMADPKSKSPSAYIDRFHYGPFGTAFAHLAFILIMVGFLVSAGLGFRNDSFSLTVGYPQEVGFDTGLVAEAKSFTDSYYEDGSPKDYVTDLAITRDGKEVKRQKIRVNDPLTIDGVMFHQATFGISGVVTVKDANGKTIFSDGVPMFYDMPERGTVYGVVTLPGTKLELFVMMPASGQQADGIAPGQARLEVYPEKEETPVGTAVLNQGASEKIGEYTYTFDREAQYTGIFVKKDPGTPIVWVGSAFLIVGTFMTMLLRHRRFWLRVEVQDGKTLVRLASHDKLETAFKRQFEAVSHDLASHLEAETTLKPTSKEN